MKDENAIEPIGILYYFGDPMCSWCWGFRPVLEQADREYPELRRVTVMGGLRRGAEEPMDDTLAEMIRGAWVRIEEATGQPFNHDFWDRHRPLATTVPACRAVTAARVLDANLEWPFMVGMFEAYFTRLMDPSQRGTHLNVAESVGFERERFAEALDSEEVDQALEKDLEWTESMGIRGFPSVVLSLRERYFLIAPGYRTIEDLRRSINTIYEANDIEFTRPESGLYS